MTRKKEPKQTYPYTRIVPSVPYVRVKLREPADDGCFYFKMKPLANGQYELEMCFGSVYSHAGGELSRDEMHAMMNAISTGLGLKYPD